MRESLHFASLPEIGAGLRDGSWTSVILTERMLERIESHGGKVNAFITVTSDRALEDARRADRELAGGQDRGPLHGVPVALKDVIDTRGIRTTAGTKHFEDRVPDEDAAVAERLSEAGAVLLGKTGLDELAWGSTGGNRHFGAIANPWDLERHAGGSSAGSAAAVSAGLAYAALGTDTGCSIRQPAHCCGVVGLKPSFGRVSKRGVMPLVWSMDHIGPITRGVRDAALVLQALVGHDPRDPYSVERPEEDFTASLEQPIDGATIAVPRRFFFDGGDDEVKGLVEEALGTFRSLGARVVDADVPGVDEAFEAARLMFVGVLAAHGETIREDPDGFSEVVHQAYDHSAHRTASEYAAARHFREEFRRTMAEFMQTYDVLLTPTSNVAADPIGGAPVEHGRERWKNSSIFDLTGQPSLSVPCGFTAAGLPVGVTVTARIHEDATALRFAHAYERAAPWQGRHPPGF